MNIQRLAEMKKFVPILFIILAFSCSGKKQEIIEVDQFPVKYENELFSFSLPEGWVCNDSNWNGLDSMRNEVDFYNPDDNTVWFHFVKTYFPIQWKNITDAKDYSKTFMFMTGENNALIEEYDSAMIAGYPTCILMVAHFVDNDTIVQKQFITYIPQSHITMYFNENFLYRNWDIGQRLGDALMENIVINEIDNPLDKKFKEQDKQIHPKGE